jgi:hypothetical protein
LRAGSYRNNNTLSIFILTLVGDESILQEVCHLIEWKKRTASMLGYFFLITGIVALLFPFNTDDVEPDRLDNSSFMAMLGGDGLAMIARIAGVILGLLGLTIIFS